MYSLKLLYQTGWNDVTTASFEGVQLTSYRHDDGIRQRYKLTGNITFWGEAFEELLSIKDTEESIVSYQLLKNGSEIHSGNLSINGMWDYNKRVCSLIDSEYDEYTFILRNLDAESNINENNDFICNVGDMDSIAWVLGETGNTPSFSIDGWIWTGEYWLYSEFNDWDENTLYQAAYFESDTEPTGNQGYMRENRYFVRKYTRIYACLQENKGVDPLNTEFWVEVTDYKKMYAVQSLMRFDNAIQYQDRIYWQIGDISEADREYNFKGQYLTDYINTFLSSIGSGLTLTSIDLPYPNNVDLVLYTNPEETESGKLELKDVFDFMSGILNAEWRINGSVLEFYQVQQNINIEVPTPDYSYPNYYINDRFNKDWSNSEFTDNPKKEIYLESFSVGKFYEEDPNFMTNIEFYLHTFVYDNDFTERMDYQTTPVEVDFAAVTRYNKNICLLAVDNGVVGVKRSELEEFDLVYNYILSVREVVRNCFKYGRPYSNAEFAINQYAYKEQIQLIKAYLSDCKIDIPYNEADLINFDYLIKSTFGDLYVKELSVNLQSASTTINAAKQ